MTSYMISSDEFSAFDDGNILPYADFKYQARDSTGLWSGVQTVFIQIQPMDDPARFGRTGAAALFDGSMSFAQWRFENNRRSQATISLWMKPLS